ncbi:MAG: low-complexity protein [Spirulina sp. SIO3F2]|nr:low-complexity protein [Spirulina sp. SIO3F2]
MSIWRKIWSALTSDLDMQTVVEGSVETFTQVLELAGQLQDNKDAKALAPLVSKLDSILDVLNSPLAQVAGAALPFLPVATGLLQFAIQKTRQEPELKDEVLLVAQVAYVEAVRCFLSEHPEISEQLTAPAGLDLQRQIQNLGNHIELSDRGIEDVLLCFHRSEVAEQLNALFWARLKESGLEPERAQLIAQRVLYGVHRQLKKAVAEVQDKARQLAAIYGAGWQQDLSAYRSIDDYLATQIAKLPQETVFDEAFTFADIYVPSAVQPVAEGEVQQHQPRQNIEDWARASLLNQQKNSPVLFIQGGPGRGKSVFCRMFADWVRRELHPIYTPILIRLRDGIDLKRNFDEALASAVGWDFVTNDSGWLTDLNTRYLFLLDGFDELFLEQGGKGSVQELLEQVSRFQERAAQNPERGHRVLITGRPLALYGIERQMPTNLNWVSIALMDKTAQADWLDRWRAVTDQATFEAFRGFIWNVDCPEQLQKLSQEPLLLYLLAKMHREGAVKVDMFLSDDANAVKVQVYEAAVHWVLTRQRPERMNERLTELEQAELRAVLAEAGLCVVQSGNERALIAMLEDRLVQRGDTAAADLIKAARSSKAKTPLKNALAAFYIKTGEADNSVEFFHKSFGEFLCAERLVESFIEWTEQGKRRRSTSFAMSDSEFEWQVYDLLGYGHLSQEILDYVMVLLKRDLTDEQWVSLFERLNDFYLRWSDGEFIEAIDVERILPLEKARQMQKWGIELGQRQTDVYTGLGLLKLLLATHNYAVNRDALKEKIRFHACGNMENLKNNIRFRKDRLVQVMRYCDSIDASMFWRQLGRDLSYAELSYANLRNINLTYAHFSFTNLSHTDLRNTHFNYTNFREANLSYADVRNAYFIHTDLRKTNLSHADLSYIDLSHANLRDADLSSTKLKEANLSESSLNITTWNSETQWANAKGLETAKNIPEALMQQPAFAAAFALSQGYALAGQGAITQAVSAYNQAQELDPAISITPRFWNRLCWYGCVHNQANLVFFVSEKLIELKPDAAMYRDTTGLAHALTGNISGAIADFEAAIQDEYFQNREEMKQKRERWLAALRSGENPFTSEELAQLREAEG